MALIKINNRMINEMKEEFDLTFEQAIELLCADLASDKRELDLINVADLIKNDYSVADCLKDHSEILQKPQFADAWPYRHDAKEFVRRIQDSVGGKYATSPAYVETMDKLFAMVECSVITFFVPISAAILNGIGSLYHGVITMRGMLSSMYPNALGTI